ncbi:cell filamentation protein Fic [Eggerthellaceae bacterium zg-887]|nr:cell filamentation protein Fic [Xiamenia xianingshaonis]
MVYEKKGALVELLSEVEASPLLARLLEEKAAGVSGGIYHKLQIELTYNSNHIEGSRLSKEQTRLIFETSTVGGDGKPVRVDDVVETANHFRCVDFCLESISKPISIAMLKDLHRMLKAGTSDSGLPWFAIGDFKTLPNEVGGRQTALPKAVPAEVENLLHDYSPRSLHTFEQIIDFHVRFERIHPFQDGNGRVGRLVMLKECLASGIVPFVITDDMKAFYYRGLAEWDRERGFLTDTCLAAQDTFKQWLDYFRIPYDAKEQR